MIETSVVKCKVYEMAEKIHSHALLNYHLVGILPATYSAERRHVGPIVYELTEVLLTFECTVEQQPAEGEDIGQENSERKGRRRKAPGQG